MKQTLILSYSLLFLIITGCTDCGCGKGTPYTGQRNQTFKVDYMSRAIGARQLDIDKSYEVSTEGTFNIKYKVQNDNYDKLTFYKSAKPTQGPLPLIIWVHSGGFIYNDRHEHIMNQLCMDFGSLGYHCASIDYRLIDDLGNVADPFNTVYEGIQDGRAAIRYFRANAQKYNINPDKIFIGGFSAGAVVALHSVLTTNENASFFTNRKSLLDDVEIVKEQGFYNSVTDNFKMPSGVISLSGAVLDAGHFLNNSTNTPPILLVHGTNDKIISKGRELLFEEYVKDIDIATPDFFFDLGICNNKTQCDVTRFKGSIGVTIPKSVTNLIRNVLTKKQRVCGGDYIYGAIKKRCYKLIIKDAPHCFMLADDGSFNQTYIDVRGKIALFLRGNAGR